MKIIKRHYLDLLIKYSEVPEIKIIKGIRRAGKTMLLNQLSAYLFSFGQDVNVIHLDLSRLENDHLTNYKTLHDFVCQSFIKGKRNFLLIDDIQHCKNFEKALASLYSKRQFNIYVAISSDSLSSSKLATLLTGRTIEIEIFPFSYQEFLTYYELDDPIRNFDKYLKRGGFAGNYISSDEEYSLKYASNVYKTILERDLIQRKNLRYKGILSNLSEYLLDNISNLTSTTSINKTLENRFQTSSKTIASYLSALTESFLFYKVNRYDIRGKKYLNVSKKYYLVDHVIRPAILGSVNQDLGRVYENIIAIDLLRRGYEVYVGVLRDKEVDFVAKKVDETLYIQVCLDLSNNETFQREVSPLLSIKDGHMKFMISRTHQALSQYQGIRIVDIGDWFATDSILKFY